MTLSLRLEAILEMLIEGRTLLDVGTDHGFLPIEAVRRGRTEEAIASDVRRGPLQRAEDHIRVAGLSGQIRTRLADGLHGLRRREADRAVIAGMGGRLMSDILRTAFEDPENGVRDLSQIVLEPQSEISIVRQTVKDSGFGIADERLVIDRDKYYFILDCRPGLTVADTEWSLPLLERKDPLYRQYLEKKLEQNLQVLAILTPSTESSKKRMSSLEEENKILREVMDRWY